MKDVLHLDLESRSTTDLTKTGVYVYVADPHTDIWCAAYAFDDEPVETWLPGEILPKRVIEHIESGKQVWAHNVNFEFHMNNIIAHRKHGWPKLTLEQSYCTMACGYAMGLPGTLEKCAAAMGIKQQKDTAGHRIMLQLCKPRGFDRNNKPVWWDDYEKIKKLIAYCKQDVEVERELHRRLMGLSKDERRVWILDQQINNRGVAVDTKNIHKVISFVKNEKIRLDAEIRQVTKNQVATCTATGQLHKWINLQGVKTPGIAKADVLDVLSRDNIPSDVREALLLRQEAAKSSTAKYETMLRGTSADGRCRGLFQYHGANTGRWAGRRIQLQNLPRPTIPQNQIDYIFKLIESGKDLSAISMFGKPLQLMSDCLRGFLIAPEGKVLVAPDFSAIEARVLAWLAGEERVLEVFRNEGKIYEHTAAAIYRIKINRVGPAQRQIGKVSTLALGFGGGVHAFQTMAVNYGVKIDESDAKIVIKNWRESHPSIITYWRLLENAMKDAILNPGAYKAGPPGRQVVFKKSGSFLWAQLPSKRVLCYPYSTIKPVKTPWGQLKNGIVYKRENPLTRKWEETKTWGGSIAENVTQAVARDLLKDAMLRLDDAGYKITLHCHDEVCVEGENLVKEQIEKIMYEVPPWAKDLPIDGTAWLGRRYKK